MAICILFIIITHEVVRGLFLAKVDVMRASIFEYFKMLCGSSISLEAEYPMNQSLKHLYTKGQLEI